MSSCSDLEGHDRGGLSSEQTIESQEHGSEWAASSSARMEVVEVGEATTKVDPLLDRKTLILSRDAILHVKPSSREACLVVLYPAGPLLGKRIRLEKDSYVIGRHPDADIHIPAESVSRRHARLVRRQSMWSIEDLNSTNGTYVNRVRLRPAVAEALRDGELIYCGEYHLKFLAGHNVEAAYHDLLYESSTLDGLTGTHNRRYFQDFLEREVAAAARHGRPLSLIMMDIDHFKKVNDSMGHPVGDLVLREVSDRIRERIRREDLFARYGGEEFVIVLRETGADGAKAFAESVRKLIESLTIQTEHGPVHITASFGVATSTGTHSLTPSALIELADKRLYRAKNRGRNRVVGNE